MDDLKRVGARPSISESYFKSSTVENKIIEFVKEGLKEKDDFWKAAKHVTSSAERLYNGVWGCVIGLYPSAISMMGGSNHITITIGKLRIYVFKRSG